MIKLNEMLERIDKESFPILSRLQSGTEDVVSVDVAKAALIELDAELRKQASSIHPSSLGVFNCPKCGRHDYGLHGACLSCNPEKGNGFRATENNPT